MRDLRSHHPGAFCLWWACVLLPVVFAIHPATSGIALVTGIALLFLTEERIHPRSLGFYLAVPAITAVLNPLFNHNGVTVLFFLNHNPVTREAVLYGLVMGLTISAALVWSRCFSAVMDTDRLLCVTGALHPKAALVLSMALRQIPMLRRQMWEMREARKGVGLLREDNMPDRIRDGARLFSGLVTRGLENGAVTADSMTARGYGSGRRTRYRPFPWTARDTALILASVLLASVWIAARARGAIGYVWYPELRIPPVSALGIAGHTAFLLLSAAGVILETGDRIRWKHLRSGT